MKKIFIYSLPAFLFTLIFATCHKPNDSIPDPNSFYFKCKINGQTYIPNSCANCITCTILKDTTLILGGNNGFQTLGIGINDNSQIKVTRYALNEIVGRQGDYKNGTLTNDRYFTDVNHIGKLQIAILDKTNKIIQGTFYFNAFNILRNDSISVTEGQFRLKYTTN